MFFFTVFHPIALLKCTILESQAFNIERKFLVQYKNNPIPSFINEKNCGLKRRKIMPKVTKLVEVLVSLRFLLYLCRTD